MASLILPSENEGGYNHFRLRAKGWQPGRQTVIFENTLWN